MDNQELWAYPKIYALGKSEVANLFDGPVYVQEKIDGSQFSFSLGEDGRIRFRSKGKEFYPEAPEKMFQKGVDVVLGIKDKLTPGWIYRGEYLQKPKHNVLAYDTIPLGHIALFDIQDKDGKFADSVSVRIEADKLDLGTVPTLTIDVPTLESIHGWLNTVSILGGQKIEGLVFKPVLYDKFNAYGQVLMGKYVSESFKEVHASQGNEGTIGISDVVAMLGSKYKSQARWNKAIQHLKEAGTLDNSPKDIGNLLNEIKADILNEEEAEIKRILWDYSWPRIQRLVINGFPEYYKAKLLESQFEKVKE